eukprot:g23581.t1
MSKQLWLNGLFLYLLLIVKTACGDGETSIANQPCASGTQQTSTHSRSALETLTFTSEAEPIDPSGGAPARLLPPPSTSFDTFNL